MPRFIMVLLWLFSDYLSEAFGTWVWPLIGFFMLPTTTQCYAVAVQGARRVHGMGRGVTILVWSSTGVLGRGRGVFKGSRDAV